MERREQGIGNREQEKPKRERERKREAGLGTETETDPKRFERMSERSGAKPWSGGVRRRDLCGFEGARKREAKAERIGRGTKRKRPKGTRSGA